MTRIIQVQSKKTGRVYELETNSYTYGVFEVLEFFGIVQKPRRICDRERGYSLVEGLDCLDDDDFILIKNEEDHSQANRVY